MKRITTFKDLIVWQKAHQRVLAIYKTTQDFPVEEKYGLAMQLRCAAASVPTNIAEGFKRKSKKDFAHFVNMADASLEETKYHLILAKDLGYLANNQYLKLTALCDEVGKMLNGLYVSLMKRKVV